MGRILQLTRADPERDSILSQWRASEGSAPRGPGFLYDVTLWARKIQTFVPCSELLISSSLKFCFQKR